MEKQVKIKIDKAKKDSMHFLKNKLLIYEKIYEILSMTVILLITVLVFIIIAKGIGYAIPKFFVTIIILLTSLLSFIIQMKPIIIANYIKNNQKRLNKLTQHIHISNISVDEYEDEADIRLKKYNSSQKEKRKR